MSRRSLIELAACMCVHILHRVDSQQRVSLNQSRRDLSPRGMLPCLIGDGDNCRSHRGEMARIQIAARGEEGAGNDCDR